MKILIVSGPNLNMLGKRNKDHYGTFTIDNLYESILNRYPDIEFTFFQSNYEGDLIEVIQNASEYRALIINAAAYTHTSVAIRDALEILDIIKVEVHLSNIYQREPFRAVNYIKDVCDQSFIGKQKDSYFEAIEYILGKLLQ